MRIQSWFKLGMKRDIPHIIDPGGLSIEVGGNPLPGQAYPYQRPHWSATDGLHEEAGSVGTIWCSHFMEHLPGDLALYILREFERVLAPGGTANIVTPYYSSQMQAQDLDHRSVWCERTWANIFDNQYYADKGGWKLKVHACFILGIVERNLALFTQLQKEIK